jgi:hypothetical protein
VARSRRDFGGHRLVTTVIAAALAGGTLILGGAAVVGSTPAGAAPAGAQGLSQTVKVTAPADAGTDPVAALYDVSCSSAGNCAGVGQYEDSSRHQQAMAASETNGVWGQASKVTAPADAGTDPRAVLFGVSCTAVGNCVGVGRYVDSSGSQQAMQASGASGVFGQAAKVTLPADAGTNPDGVLQGVSCTGAGNCTGVGRYVDSSGHNQAMAASESSGVWGQAVKVTAPADAGTDPGGWLQAVSCPSVGNCAVVGQYVDSSGHHQAMQASETSGVWALAAKVTLPAGAATDPLAALYGVSCTSTGNCAGVGSYADSSGGQAMEASETNGVWGQAAKVTTPADAGTDPGAYLHGVSCLSAGNCAGVGSYVDSSGHHEVMGASATGGVWGQAFKVTAPPDAGTDPGAYLRGVSCPSAGNCAGVGQYLDSSGHTQAMAASESSPPTSTTPVVSSNQFGIPNQTDVFEVAPNGAVEVFWVDGAGTWNGPLAISSPGLASPGAHLAASNQFGVSNQTDVLVVDHTGTVQVLWVDGVGAWHGPLAVSRSGFAPAGAHLAASNQFGISNQTDVFVSDSSGTLKVVWVNGVSTWHGPLQIGAAGFAPAGAALTSSNQFGIPNQTDVWEVAGDGAVHVFWVQGATGAPWHGPLQIGGAGFAPAGAALTSSNQFGIPNQTDVWEVAGDGAVHVFWVQGAGAWDGPLRIGGAGFAPAGAALTSSNQFGVPNQTDVWEVAGDGAVHVFWVQGADGAPWHGPLQIGAAGFAPAGAALTSSNQFGIPNQTDVWEVAGDGAIDVFWVQGAGAWKGPLGI